MKKLSIISLIALSGFSVLAQGTLQFQNTVLTAFYTNTTATGGTRGKVGTAAGTMNYALFYSDATTGGTASSLSFATAVGNSTTSAGLIQGSTILPLAGTNPGDAVYIEMIAYSGLLSGYSQFLNPGSNGDWTGTGAWFGKTPVIEILNLGATSGPGQVMFQNDASHIGTVNGFTDITVVPEPATFALAGLGAAAMLIFRRRK